MGLKIKYLLKAGLICAVSLALCGGISAVQAGDANQDVMAAAKEYEKTIPTVEMLEKMAASSLERAPAYQKEKLRIVFNTLDKKKIRADVLDLMAAHFTAEELRALAAFYGSDAGQAISRKFPEYAEERMNVIQKAIMAELIKVGKQEQQNSAQ